MSGPDWCRFYPGKWLTGTFNLSNEQRGVYIQIVAIIMDRGDCPADYRYLGRVCNLRSHCVKRIVGELIDAGKIIESGSKLHQNRAETERELALNLTETQRLKALKGWETKRLKDANRQSQPQPQPQDSESPSTVAAYSPPPEPRSHNVRPVVGRDAFDRLWLLQRMPRQKRGKDQAQKAWRAACTRAPPDDIIARFDEFQECWERYGYEVGHVPHLSTWLSQSRWQDDLPAPRPGSMTNGSGRKDHYAKRIYERHGYNEGEPEAPDRRSDLPLLEGREKGWGRP